MHDQLRYWIETALDANRVDHTDTTVPEAQKQTGPFRSARALAMTLIAMHDAYVTVAGAGAAYRPELLPTTARGGDPVSAAVGAAFATLNGLYASQARFFAVRWADYIARYQVDRLSLAFGQAVGLACVNWRLPADAPHLLPGAHMPVADYDHAEDPLEPGQGYNGVLWGGAASFFPGMTLQGLASPPGTKVVDGQIPSGADIGFEPGEYYEKELAEVAEYGGLASAKRSAEQLEIGIYWGYDGPKELGTPPRLYMQVALAVLDQRPRPLPEAAWLHALSAVAIGMADAGIQAWHYKWSPLHMLWRPVLGVRHAQAPGSPPWRPYGKPLTNMPGAQQGATPNFPAYPSGHATFGAVAFELLRRFLRKAEGLRFTDDQDDPIGFVFVSDEFDGRNIDPTTGFSRPRRPRHYPSLWKAIVDNSESRIWLGVHWRMDGISLRAADGSSVSGSPRNPGELGDFGGVQLGMRIARSIAAQRGF